MKLTSSEKNDKKVVPLFQYFLFQCVAIFFAISFCDLNTVMLIIYIVFLLPVKSSESHFSYTEADRKEFAAYLASSHRRGRRPCSCCECGESGGRCWIEMIMTIKMMKSKETINKIVQVLHSVNFCESPIHWVFLMQTKFYKYVFDDAFCCGIDCGLYGSQWCGLNVAHSFHMGVE